MTLTNHLLHRIVVSAALCCITLGAHAATEPAKPASPLTISGDLRLRYEWDWDSQNAAGVPRADRDRARYRARAVLGYKFSDAWSFGTRLRTGNRLSQQSTHLTFYASDNLTDDFGVSFDRYYLQFKQTGLTVWGGRNTTPFWAQNEMFWDEDVTLTGLAFARETKTGQGSLTATTGLFLLPDGAVEFNGTMLGGQLKYVLPVKPSQFTFAAGLHRLFGKDGAEVLLTRNGARNYLVGVLSAQWSTPLAEGRPFALGVDFIHNFESYSTAEVAPLAPRQADEKTGYVFSATLGQTKNPHDWQLYYSYVHIETLAVNASYSADDWARFGSGPQSAVTDITGHEFRGTYVLTKSLNVDARLFLVEAITSVQDGKRFRINLNWKF